MRTFLRTFSIFLLGFSTQLFAQQLNMSLHSHVDYHQLHNTTLNDVWGYVDEQGNEYALVGTTHGISIVNVTSPGNPQEVAWFPSTENIWRDVVTWGDYAYVTTEAADGLLIIDLSPLPASNNLPTTYYHGTTANPLTSAHTVFATDGYCYVFGSNIDVGGVQIYDIHSNPMAPNFVGSFNNWYVHDGYVQNDTMYLGHIYEGFFSIVDVTDKSNPILLGTKSTPHEFTHNIWPTPDGNFAYTTDEVSGAFLAAYDISDPANIVEVDRIRSAPGSNVVPHNTHWINNFLVTSYYAEGVTIHDVTYPYNMIEVGRFDTYPFQTPGFDGCWGAYPYLPSGNVLATDREYGLFVLNATYQQAAYLEGIITDVATALPIELARIEILNYAPYNESNVTGFYATGLPVGGNVIVRYDKMGYYAQTDTLQLVNGQITTHDVALVPIPPYDIQVVVKDEQTNTTIDNVFVRFENNYLQHDGITNGIGVEDMILYYEGEYLLTVGKWGYITKCQTLSVDDSTEVIEVLIKKGYYDDFSFDFGWVATGDAQKGQWVRAIPFATQEMANPGFDSPIDCGEYAFVTGNLPEFVFTEDEVENGFVQLQSPVMDLSSLTNPHVNYHRWFYNAYGDEIGYDSLEIFLKIPTSQVKIDVVKRLPQMDVWRFRSIPVLDYIQDVSAVQLVVYTSDFGPAFNVTEAGFDNFFVSNGSTVGLEDFSTKDEIVVFPNPFNEQITIKNAVIGSVFEIIDLNGKSLMSGELKVSNANIDTQQLPKGLYLLLVNEQIFKLVK